MKKGFTLIELLAVIIILAIVALIATPIILDVIADAQKSAAKSEAQLIVGGIEQGCATAMVAVQLDNPSDEDLAIRDWCVGGSAGSTENDITMTDLNGDSTTEPDISDVLGTFNNMGDAKLTDFNVKGNKLVSGTIESNGYYISVADGKLGDPSDTAPVAP